MRIFLIRHARTRWNDEKRIQGWADVEPYEEAKEKFKETVAGIKFKPDVIFSSDLRRAIVSAQIIRSLHGDIPVLIDWRLRERNMGKLEGVFSESIKEKYPQLWGTVDVRPEGGESVLDMGDRLSRALMDILWFSNLKGWESVYVVSHQLAIEVMRRILKGEPIEPSLWNNLIGSDQWIEVNLSFPS